MIQQQFNDGGFHSRTFAASPTALSDNMFADLIPSSPTYNPTQSLPGDTSTPVAPVSPYTPVQYSVPGASSGASGGADWNAYLSSNPDVAANYANVNHSQFPTAQSYAQWHYQHYGQNEGRSLPTLGSSTAPNPAPTPAPAPATPATPATPSPTTTATDTSGNPIPASPALPNATDIIRSTPGYQFQLQQGLDALNSNAYARGIANSGATDKALVGYGQNYADNYYQQYLNNVMGVAAGGASAAGALNGVSQNYANNSNAISQNAANAASNNAMYGAQQNANMYTGIATGIGTIANSGLFNSSYNPIGSPNLGAMQPVSIAGAQPLSSVPVNWGTSLGAGF